jgi:hypothetical protein
MVLLQKEPPGMGYCTKRGRGLGAESGVLCTKNPPKAIIAAAEGIEIKNGSLGDF